jgi:hypothetical protein
VLKSEVDPHGRRACVMAPSYIPVKRLSGGWGLHRLLFIKLILRRCNRLSLRPSRIHTLLKCEQSTSSMFCSTSAVLPRLVRTLVGWWLYYIPFECPRGHFNTTFLVLEQCARRSLFVFRHLFPLFSSSSLFSHPLPLLLICFCCAGIRRFQSDIPHTRFTDYAHSFLATFFYPRQK